MPRALIGTPKKIIGRNLKEFAELDHYVKIKRFRSSLVTANARRGNAYFFGSSFCVKPFSDRSSFILYPKDNSFFCIIVFSPFIIFMILLIIFMIMCYNFYMKNFGEKIKELRKGKKLTQEGLAQQIGQAQSTIYYWEKNKQEPTISALKKLCEFFEVSADYLLGLKDED